jgi:hypothetical protein
MSDNTTRTAQELYTDAGRLRIIIEEGLGAIVEELQLLRELLEANADVLP